ncbi:MAG: Gfo/Idh/MocA family oxidoreductase [Spirochaetaceae bacterium]|nr:Gfo/Idh/MocA family oxidoreductase [Spirochaetaceae bacterium]MCF7949561.1 Gfo/Idh/MocA family oxidoreductase [Spirochaetia bacterium]MCF7951999.1 Gfo/Idh/MocA family oxidoreductase [Spirochaetaceae bacterium]
MKKLRVAIVGTGFIGPVHAEAVRRNPELAELVALAGASKEDAAEAAAKLNVPDFTGDYTELLKRNDIDVVHICTPNYLHYPMVKECLNHGKNVLCEKPLALTADEARELMQLAEKKGLKAAVNYNLRYYPMVQEMRCRNLDRLTGSVFAVQGSYLQDWLQHDNDYSWRMESRLSGKSRAVADIGTHWMDMAQYVTGLRIERVFAQFGRMYDTRKKSAAGKDITFSKGSDKDTSDYISYTVDTEDYAQIMLQFENGVIGNLTVSQVMAGYKNFMEFRQMGTEASLSWDSESPNKIQIGHRDRPNEILMKDPSLLHERPASMSAFPGGHQEGYGDTIKYMIREFYSDLLELRVDGSRADYPTLADGTAEMVLCEAIIESAQKSEWTEVRPVGEVVV